MIKTPEKSKSIFDKTIEDIYKEEKKKQKIKSVLSQGSSRREEKEDREKEYLNFK